MDFSYEELMNFIDEEDVKFIRLAFSDINGKQKNISIMPGELERAFRDGISFDASAVPGFAKEIKSDLFLFPDSSTLSILPWRPTHGRVVRMFCDIKYPDDRPFVEDSRYILKQAVAKAKKMGIRCYFGSEFEFYLFKTDEEGNSTGVPFDRAGYMDIAPEDKGENIRREICFMLVDMGIKPESSHHEEGQGQNEIDFRYSDALSAADNAVTFKTVVRTVAMRNGLYADFSPKPMADDSGNGMHINMSIKSDDGKDYTEQFMAGIMTHIGEMTVFLNPVEESYHRLGEKKAPKYITWSKENRSQLIRIPAAKGEFKRIELRSPDPEANPYIAYTLLIHAGLDGIKRNLTLPEAMDIDLFNASEEVLKDLTSLPQSLEEAWEKAVTSEFIREILPSNYLQNHR
ncbi:MAG: type I glutamate--ammonia ligase [Clostridiales bacterium]|nr:MAG: type I glutamate--ammonia ligase [Clostridiales bacterium]